MIERERKFMLKYLPSNLDCVEIRQGYLMVDEKQQLRVRISESKAFICYKSCINFDSRNEYEYEIPLNDGLELFNSCENKLVKKRYKATFHGMPVDIDVYPFGLSIVEIEYVNKLDIIPDFCGEEITGLYEFSNVFLAKNSDIKYVGIVCRDSDDFINNRLKTFPNCEVLSRRKFKQGKTIFCCISEKNDVFGYKYYMVLDTESASQNPEYEHLMKLAEKI